MHSPLLPSENNVVILGSGLPAALSAMLLAHAGCGVTVLERCSHTGGLAGSYTRQGFRVDLGTPLFTQSDGGPIGEAFNRVGAPDAVSLGNLSPHKIRGNGLYLHVPRSPLVLPLTWLSLANQAHMGPRGWLRLASLAFDVVTEHSLPKRESGWGAALASLADYRRDPELSRLLAALASTLGCEPHGPAMAASLHRFFGGGFHYPLGGLHGITRAALATARGFGARVFTRTSVRRVIRENGRLKSVEDTSGRAHAANLVLVPPRANGATGRSEAVVQLKWALRRPLLRAGMLLGTTPPARRGTRKQHPALPFVCVSPSHADAEAAPYEGQLLSAYLYDRHDAASRLTEKAMLDLLAAGLRREIPGIDGETVFIDRIGARFMESIDDAGDMPLDRDSDLRKLWGTRLIELPRAVACGPGAEAAAEQVLRLTEGLTRELSQPAPADERRKDATVQRLSA